MMFIGEYIHNIDEKGRLAVPVKFRNRLSGGAVVTKGLDNCLSLYPEDAWAKQADKLVNLPQTQSKSRAYARFVLAGAFPVEIDKQGRVNVPPMLRKFAGIKGQVIVTGLGDHIEIWAKDAWEAYSATVEKDSVDIAEELGI
jgi:MraZ protein